MRKDLFIHLAIEGGNAIARMKSADEQAKGQMRFMNQHCVSYGSYQITHWLAFSVVSTSSLTSV